jgi:putative ABC transport system substrate-binding protein
MKLGSVGSISIATLLAVAVFAGAAPAASQQAASVKRIGMFSPSIALSGWRDAPPVRAFLAGLRGLGYEEGRNLAIEFRSAEGNWARLPDIAAELVSLRVDVLIPNVCGAPLDAARHATSTIPIVVPACNDDLVETGVVASLAHPGGNITGLAKVTPELTAKRLELLKEMVPTATRVAVLWDPGYSAFLADWREIRARALLKGVTLQSVEAHDVSDLDRAFDAMTRARADAVMTFSDTMTYNSPGRVTQLAAESKLPLMSPFRELAQAGALASYGPSIPHMFWRAATYVDKILKGAKPAELPIEQPTKFEMIINLKTAKTLGLAIPPALLLRADEVIE